MSKRTMFASLAILGTLGLGPAFADPADCNAIGLAKFEQWRQPELQITRSKTFADGSMKSDLLIVTGNTAYFRGLGGWTSAGITLRERAVATPAEILKAMRLANCTKGASMQEGGQPVTQYTYSYTPDGNGFVARGTMWISDATGLPVREDMMEAAPPANGQVARAISATYRYNADVVIPRSAELAESRRLNNNASVVRNMQSGSAGGLGGPQQ